jgi:phage-related protein
MEKEIKVIFLNQAESFVDKMEDKARLKLFRAVRKVQERIFGDWFSKMSGSDGIFEFRIVENGIFYRLFAFWDTKDYKTTLVVATHGITKKSNKTPKGEIQKAENIKNEYFKNKLGKK